MSTYCVTRTETIVYARDYTREELIEAGVPAQVFTDGDLTADFADAVYSNPALAEWLESRDDRHGDVQGSGFKIETVTP